MSGVSGGDGGSDGMNGSLGGTNGSQRRWKAEKTRGLKHGAREEGLIDCLMSILCSIVFLIVPID